MNTPLPRIAPELVLAIIVQWLRSLGGKPEDYDPHLIAAAIEQGEHLEWAREKGLIE